MNLNHPPTSPPIGYLSPAWPIEDMPNGIVSYIATIRDGLKKHGVESAVFVGRAPRVGERDVVAVPSDWTLLERVRRSLRHRAGLPPDPHAPLIRELRRSISRMVPEGLKLFEMEESFGLADRVKLPGVARVVRLHGPWFLNGAALGEPQGRVFRARVQKEGRAIARATAVTAPSKDVLDQVREHYQLALPSARVIANPGPAVASDECWQASRAKPRQVLFVGRFDRHKGADVVLRAFARLAVEDPEIELVFAGPDRGLKENGRSISLADYVDQHVPHHVRERLHVLGPVGFERLAELRRESALCVVPSRYETFSMVTVETLAFGCPVVGAATGGIKEIIADGKNGLLVRPEDVDDLVAKMRALLADSGMSRRLAQEGRRTYEERFEPGRVAAETLDFYRALPGCSGL